jgi:DNA-binding response OmpR family regulator
MASVLLLSADLMFSSRLLAALTAAGHEVELLDNDVGLRERLPVTEESSDSVLIVDLTDDRHDGAATLEKLRGEGRVDSTATLAFYSHVDTEVRERAERAGFDLVVPRSRMAREATNLLATMTAH